MLRVLVKIYSTLVLLFLGLFLLIQFIDLMNRFTAILIFNITNTGIAQTAHCIIFYR